VDIAEAQAEVVVELGIALNLNGFEKPKAGRAVLNYGQISTNLNSEQFSRLPLTVKNKYSNELWKKKLMKYY
jgi:hypothetical protein